MDEQAIFPLCSTAHHQHLTAKAHRPAYGSDGDYFSKPSLDDIVEKAYKMLHEADPNRFLHFKPIQFLTPFLSSTPQWAYFEHQHLCFLNRILLKAVKPCRLTHRIFLGCGLIIFNEK